MSEETKEAAAAAPTVDVAKLKEEMIEATRINNETMMRTIMESINANKTSNVEEDDEQETVVSKEFNEFEDEVKELGLDEKQTKALASMIRKMAGKDIGKVKKEVVSEIAENSRSEQKKAQLEQQAASQYPDILDKNSALFKETSKVYESMSTDVKKAPEATYLAIKTAAANLGMQAMDLNALRAAEAKNNTTSGGSGTPNRGEVTEKQKNFAKAFSVNPDKFSKHLKQIQAKKM